MFDRTKNFLNLVGASHRTAHALKNGAHPMVSDLETIGVNQERFQPFKKGL